MRRLRASLLAVVVALTAGLSGVPAHAGEVVFVDGVAYELIAQGTVPLPTTVQVGDGDRLGGLLDWVVIGCTAPRHTGADAHFPAPPKIGWRALAGGGGAIYYQWFGAGWAEAKDVTNGCLQSVTASVQVFDQPVVPSVGPSQGLNLLPNQLSGRSVSVTKALDSSRYARAVVPDSAPATVLADYYTSTDFAGLVSSRALVGSATVRTDGYYTYTDPFGSAVRLHFACKEITVRFVPSPTGPTNLTSDPQQDCQQAILQVGP